MARHSVKRCCALERCSEDIDNHFWLPLTSACWRSGGRLSHLSWYPCSSCCCSGDIEDHAFGAAAAEAAGGAGAAGACATALAAARNRLAHMNNALNIISLPGATVREDFLRAAAPSSRIPTKQHHPHHPCPKT